MEMLFVLRETLFSAPLQDYYATMPFPFLAVGIISPTVYNKGWNQLGIPKSPIARNQPTRPQNHESILGLHASVNLYGILKMYK
jgi:hypothetical protein